MKQLPYERNLVCLKVGTNSVLTEKGFNHQLISRMAKLRDNLNSPELDTDLVVVTSGSIGAGLMDLGIPRSERPAKDKRAELSALSSVGQINLMRKYQMAFGVGRVGQVLVEQRNFEGRETSQHLGRVVRGLLEMGVTPVINENDAINDGAIAKEDDNEAKDRENDFIALSTAAMLKYELKLEPSQLVGVKATTTKGLLGDVNKPLSTVSTIESVDHVNRFLMESVDNTSIELGTSGGQKREVLIGYLELGVPYWIMHHSNVGIIPELLRGHKQGQYEAQRNATLVMSTEPQSSV